MLEQLLSLVRRNGSAAARNGVLTPAPRQEAPPAGVRRIELDYEIHPRPRSLRGGAAGARLLGLLEGSLPRARELVRELARFDARFRAIPPQASAAEPHWRNGWFPPFDAMTLYGLLATRNPRIFVEVGSGNSTLFARRAIREHGLRTKIVSIDPCPRAEIDALCDEVIRAPFESVDVAEVARLTREDLLFVDSSHRAFQNSDVTVLFTEVLPGLPSGLVYGMHDIFLPNDYPLEWRERFYSEQYLLLAYLLGGAGGDEVLAPLSYLATETDVLAPLAPTFDALGLPNELRYGSAFWLRKA